MCAQVFVFTARLYVHLCVHLFVSKCTVLVYQSESLEVNIEPIKYVTFLPHPDSQILHITLVLQRVTLSHNCHRLFIL